MNKKVQKEHRKRKRRIQRRLRKRQWEEQDRPMLAARNIRYEIAGRGRGMAVGGIGAIHRLARRVGLIEEINEALSLLKVHLPYHESDHVLNIAYNLLAGGTCLEDLEWLRNDEAYLDALGAQRIPDPTTAGDFCRRFRAADVEALLDAVNRVRVRVWRQQPAAFFKRAVIDVDGTLADTTGECKDGMDINYKGGWGYHPLVVSLANTGEPLFLVNRSGNRPSHEGAAARLDASIALCREARFEQIALRGDTDFTQTAHLDRWDDEAGVTFTFGMAAMANLVARAEALPDAAWTPLARRPKYTVKTQARARPENVKERIVREREYLNIRLQSEQVAEFAYAPTQCKKTYRMVVLRKNLTQERGEQALIDDVRYFFYLTNDPARSAAEVVFECNDRCNQENLIAQLKSGVPAMTMPVDGLVSNWAYLVMASLAWTLKAWFALSLPESGRWAKKHRREKQAVVRMEFKTFVNAFMRLPCRIVKTGRRIVYRLLSYNPWQHVFLRAVTAVSTPLRC